MLQGIWFSTTPVEASVALGDRVDIAFQPQINDFRGERTVQLNVTDIRPACTAECGVDTAGYRALREGTLCPAVAAELTPDRGVLATVWRYLAAVPGGLLEESPICLCRKIVRWSEQPLDLGKLLTCLDIFSDVGLIEVRRLHKYITIRLLPTQGKTDLNTSKTMQRLSAAKESENNGNIF